MSSSCSSVYVDGSEARGSVNGSVLVKYGTYTGLARFTVWMPEFPLDLQVADFRLSQIKSWRVPDTHPRWVNIGFFHFLARGRDNYSPKYSTKNITAITCINKRTHMNIADYWSIFYGRFPWSIKKSMHWLGRMLRRVVDLFKAASKIGYFIKSLILEGVLWENSVRSTIDLQVEVNSNLFSSTYLPWLNTKKIPTISISFNLAKNYSEANRYFFQYSAKIAAYHLFI